MPPVYRVPLEAPGGRAERNKKWERRGEEGQWMVRVHGFPRLMKERLPCHENYKTSGIGGRCELSSRRGGSRYVVLVMARVDGTASISIDSTVTSDNSHSLLHVGWSFVLSEWVVDAHTSSFVKYLCFSLYAGYIKKIYPTLNALIEISVFIARRPKHYLFITLTSQRSNKYM